MAVTSKLITIMNMVGCAPCTKDQLAICERMTIKHYGNYNIEELMLAFEMNATGKLAEKVKPYDVFSFDFISSVMYLYTQKANQVRKGIKPIEEDQPVPQLDPLDIIEYSFQEWRNSNKNFERLFNGVRVFELIHELGLKTWTKEDGHAARKNLNNLIEFKANKMNLVDAKQYRETWTDEWLKLMGKNIAVAMWFEEQIEKGKNTLK